MSEDQKNRHQGHRESDDDGRKSHESIDDDDQRSPSRKRADGNGCPSGQRDDRRNQHGSKAHPQAQKDDVHEHGIESGQEADRLNECC